MRKGDLLTDNFLEILLAVIGLVLVGYVAYQIYQVTVNQEATIAKKMLDSLEAKINLLNVGEEGEYTLRAPCKKGGTNAEGTPKLECLWYLTGWGKESLDRPEKCYFKSCVCVCKIDGKLSTDKDRCQVNGYCRFFEDEHITIISNYMSGQSGGSAGVGAAPAIIPVAGTGIKLQPLHLLKVSKTTEGVTIRSA